MPETESNPTTPPIEPDGKPLARAPLHRQLAARLRQEIATRYKPGDKLESQNVLAQRFGISVLTVREALSGLADEGVISRRRGSGTYVLDPTRHQAVAVLMELDIAHPNTSYSFRRLAQQVRLRVRERGLKVRLYAGYVPPGDDRQPFGSLGTTCPDYLEDLESGRVQGVIVVAGMSRTLYEQTAALSIPVVGTEPWMPFGLEQSHAEAVAMGLDELLRAGRRRLAFMSWGDPGLLLRLARERGLDLRPEWIRCDIHPATPGAGGLELRDIWNARQEKPDGLLITDDVLFGSAIPAIDRLDIAVPDSLCVVTHCCAGVQYPARFPFIGIQTDPDRQAELLVGVTTALLAGQTPEIKRPRLTPEIVRR